MKTSEYTTCILTAYHFISFVNIFDLLIIIMYLKLNDNLSTNKNGWKILAVNDSRYIIR